MAGPVGAGWLGGASGTRGRRVTLHRRTRDAFDAACSPGSGERLGGLGPAELRDCGPAGIVWRAPGLGDYLVAPDGRTVEAVHASGSGWEAFFTGQVLPLCAVLQGLEVLHAGAAVLDGAAVALAGGSGAGKSTVLAALLDCGADFLADDVAALEPDGARVLVHPGPASLKLRPDAASQPPRGAQAVHRAPDGERFAVTPRSVPAPLAAVAVLVRATEPAIEETAGDPQLLLGANFVPLLRGPERLRRLLDVCAAVAASARMLRVGVPPGADPHAVAARLREALG